MNLRALSGFLKTAGLFTSLYWASKLINGNYSLFAFGITLMVGSWYVLDFYHKSRTTGIEEELKVYERLMTERDKIMAAIPECSVHGKQCVPHALEWIEIQKQNK